MATLIVFANNFRPPEKLAKNFRKRQLLFVIEPLCKQTRVGLIWRISLSNFSFELLFRISLANFSFEFFSLESTSLEYLANIVRISGSRAWSMLPGALVIRTSTSCKIAVNHLERFVRRFGRRFRWFRRFRLERLRWFKRLRGRLRLLRRSRLFKPFRRFVRRSCARLSNPIERTG